MCGFEHFLCGYAHLFYRFCFVVIDYYIILIVARCLPP